MKHVFRLAIVIFILLLLFLFRLVLLLPKLPPKESRGVCTVCHWDKRDKHPHNEENFTDGRCLKCHNPHTHFGRPYLPQIESCVICHPQYRPKRGLVVHKPVQQQQCLSCHMPHRLFERSVLRVGLDMLCNSCHKDDLLKYENPVGHMPYEKRQCLSCHEAHMAPHRALLRTPLDMLCQSCHRMEKEWTFPVQHMPFARGKCLDCHDPHASGWRGLTKQSQPVLCYSCHYDRKGEWKRPLRHGPYGGGDCTDCHEPHSAVAKNLLPREKMDEFCFLCHSRIRNLGWYNSPHAGVFEGRSCLGCHEHHSADYSFLTRLPLHGRGNLCLTCHNHIGEFYIRTAHGVLRCGQCHQVHGSQELYLLHTYEIDLCNRCHPGLRHRSTNHPVGGSYWDIIRNRQMLCTGCHGPHGTRFDKMKVRFGNHLCMPCHDNIR